MAKTYAYAIAGGLIATFTVSPALSALLLPDSVERDGNARSCARCAASIGRSSSSRSPTASSRLARRAAAARARRWLAVRSLGLEFLPKLEEGNLWIRATMPPSISLRGGQRLRQPHAARSSRAIPEVETVVSQHGRPDDGTDATGFFNAEFFVPLKPFDTWPTGVDKDKLTEQMTHALEERFPGRRVQFLAVHRGQRRGGGLRRQGRELGQALRQRSRDAGARPPTRSRP